MDQHAQSPERACAATRRLPEKRRYRRVIHEVGDELTPMKKSSIHNDFGRFPAAFLVPFRLPMPIGVACTTRSDPGTSSSVPTRPTSPAREAARTARWGVRFTTTTSAAPAPARAHTTAAGRSSRPEHQGAFPGRIGARTAPERRQEPQSVGRVPEQPPVAKRHAVDRCESCCKVAALVHDRGGSVLVRRSDGQTGYAESPHSLEDCRNLARANLEPHRHPVEAHGIECGIVQKWRQRVHDGIPDHPDYPRGSRGPRRRFASRRRPSS